MDTAYTIDQPPVPIESIPAAPVPAAPVPEKKYLLTKKAYNRIGLAALFVYLSAQVIATVMLAVIAVGYVCSTIDELLEYRYYEDGERLISYILQTVTDIMNPNGLIYGIYSLGSYVVGFGSALLIEKRFVQSVPATPIPKRKLTAAEFGLYTVVALGMWGVGVYVGNIPSFFGVPSIMDSVYGTDGPGILFMSASAIFCAPILEELLFRKVMLDKLHVYGQIPAAFVSALIFGLMHGNAGQFFLAFNVGLVFAVIYMKTGNILYTMTLHFIINFTASLPELLAYFGVTGVGSVSFDLLLYILVAVLAVVGSAVLILNRKNELFAITKSECPNLHKAILSNPGMWIFPILACVSVLGVDVFSFVYNIIYYRTGAISLLIFIPLGLFIAAILVFYINIGTKSGAEIVCIHYGAPGNLTVPASDSTLPAADEASTPDCEPDADSEST